MMSFSKKQIKLNVLESTCLHENLPLMLIIHLLSLKLNIFVFLINVLKHKIGFILKHLTLLYINKYDQ